jgi:hypothetical protein
MLKEALLGRLNSSGDRKKEVSEKPITSEQKQTILKYLDTYYKYYFNYKFGKVFDEKDATDWELKRQELEGILSDPESGFEINSKTAKVSAQDRAVINAKTALWEDIKKNPEDFAEHKEVLERALTSELLTLWEKYNKPFITFNAPGVAINEWLNEGKNKEAEIIKKYGGALGEDRVVGAIENSRKRNQDETDYLAKALQLFPGSVLAMSLDEIKVNFYQGKRLPENYKQWFSAV